MCIILLGHVILDVLKDKSLNNFNLNNPHHQNIQNITICWGFLIHVLKPITSKEFSREYRDQFANLDTLGILVY